MTRKPFLWLSIFVLIAVFLASCAPPPDLSTPVPAETQPAAAVTEQPNEGAQPTEAGQPTEAPVMSMELPPVDPANVTGNIISAGSSTVYPLSEVIAEQFTNEGYAGKITIDSIGSGAGFSRFCEAGETDISNASRKIKDTEIASCQAIGRDPIEFRVGTDALAVVVSNDNDFVQNLTKEQLALAFSTAKTWADVDPSFPAEPIQRFSPGTDSGTFDYFVETVMTPANGDDADAGKAAILESVGTQFSEDDNVLVQGVAGSPYAIGYFGFAYAQENTDLIHPISVEGVEPNFETAESNEYPLSRPLFIYSDAGILQSKPQVADFINYFLTNVNDLIQDIGYFPASVEALDASKQAYLDATGQ
jgi:phosphate transport system substrate-binding protein